MPFDPVRLEVTGAAIAVVEGVLQSLAGGGGAIQRFQHRIASLYCGARSVSPEQIAVWVSPNGVEQPLAAPVRAYGVPRLSPDGRQVAVGILEEESHLWLYDLARETLTRFTFQGNYNPVSVWTPDGKRIAFESNQEGPPNLFLAVGQRRW